MHGTATVDQLPTDSGYEHVSEASVERRAPSSTIPRANCAAAPSQHPPLTTWQSRARPSLAAFALLGPEHQHAASAADSDASAATDTACTHAAFTMGSSSPISRRADGTIASSRLRIPRPPSSSMRRLLTKHAQEHAARSTSGVSSPTTCRASGATSAASCPPSRDPRARTHPVGARLRRSDARAHPAPSLVLSTQPCGRRSSSASLCADTPAGTPLRARPRLAPHTGSLCLEIRDGEPGARDAGAGGGRAAVQPAPLPRRRRAGPVRGRPPPARAAARARPLCLPPLARRSQMQDEDTPANAEPV